MKCGIPHAAIHLAVATILLAITLRTWLVMGLIDPVAVAGSSMAPTLRGPFVEATCPDCQTGVDVGAEFADRTKFVACPSCGRARVPLASSPFHLADRLRIDRTVFNWRAPRRWEVVVSRQPDDGGQLCVKRLVGLPGETIRILHGDVWANQRVLTKSLAEQCAMRRMVHRENGVHHRWRARENSKWQWHDGRWQCTADDPKNEYQLHYVHHRRQPITDNLTYNAGLSRRLNLVRDFMLSANLRVRGEGTLALESSDGQQTSRVMIRPSDGSIRLDDRGKTVWSGFLLPKLCRRMRQDDVRLVYSNFDRQLLLAIDGQVQLRYPLDGEAPPVGTAHPFTVGAKGLAVSLGDLTLYRDVYYASHPVGTRPAADAQTQLAENEYFLLGDNSPVSIDSRSWGPVSGHWLLGKPLWIR